MKLPLLALVFVGGGIGSVCRYAMASALQRTFPGPFPTGTFWVNLAGCFAIGLVGALGLERAALSPEARTFLMVGILGGFTTFSAYTVETLGLLRVGQAPTALAYLFGTVILGLLATWTGIAVARKAAGISPRQA